LRAGGFFLSEGRAGLVPRRASPSRACVWIVITGGAEVVALRAVRVGGDVGRNVGAVAPGVARRRMRARVRSGAVGLSRKNRRLNRHDGFARSLGMRQRE
jgi:hypothetical protein